MQHAMPCSLSLQQPGQDVISALIFLLITLTPLLLGGCLGQQSVTDLLYGLCNTNVYSSNDTFAANYNTVVAALEQNASTALYGIAASKSSSQSDYVYGIYQCRGDVSLSDCHSCVYNAFYRISGGCGRARGAQAQFTGCFIRYENYAFDTAAANTQQTGAYKVAPQCSDSKLAPAHSSAYLHNVGVALNDSATAAPKHALFGYNASSVGTGSSAAYVLTQCMGYLSTSECADCLVRVSNFSNACNQSVSGTVFFEACYYLYSNTSLLFTYTDINSSSGNTLSPPPASSPVPSPPPASTQYGVPDQKKKQHTTRIIVGIVVGTSLALVAVVSFALMCFRKRKRHVVSSASNAYPDALLSPYNLAYQPCTIKFSLMELQEATNYFSPYNILGEGGFGPVYQGRLKSGREVAIKRLSAGSHQGKTEFENEVSLISTVQHRNLIQLLGCYVPPDDTSKPLLVYEYLPNRSLDLHLFDVSDGKILNWRTRFDIIVGIARGLTYLHEDSHVRIVHRDIKSTNILLDSNMTPKIADFGLARLFAEDVSHVKTKVAGTLGYLAPEYAMSGQLTAKVDVYAFGMVALEIVSGRKVLDSNMKSDEQNLLYWAWTLYESGQPAQIIDYRLQLKSSDMLKNGVNVGQVIRVVHVSLLCTQAQPHLRPSMSQVHSMLCGESQILELPTKPLMVAPIRDHGEVIHGSSTSSWSYEAASHATISCDGRDPISQVEPR